MSHRLSVNMNNDTAAALNDIAKRHDLTITEAVRRVISVAKFIDDEARKGHIIIIEQPNGRRRELVMM